jgi:hypothetical protein
MDNALELALPHALAGLLLRKDIGRLLPDTGEGSPPYKAVCATPGARH